MDKKKKIIIMIGVLILLLLLIFMFFSQNNGNKDYRRLKNNYEKLNGKVNDNGKKYSSVTINSTDLIENINIDKVLNILTNGSGVIYIGSNKSEYSRKAINILMEASNSSNIDKVYYYDIDSLCDIKKLDQKTGIIKDCDDKISKLYEKLKDIYVDYTTESNILIIPTVLFVSNGSIVSSNIKTIPTHKNPYSKLVESQKKALKEIYMSGIKDID